MHCLDVRIPYAEIEARRERWARAQRFERVSPAVVFTPFHSRYFVGSYGASPERYFHDSELMLAVQLYWKAWVLNNVRSDFHDLSAWVDQGHYGESWGLGCELGFDDFSPWIKTHPVRCEADLLAVARADPLDNPAAAHEAAMRARMSALAEAYVLRFADGVQVQIAAGMRPRNDSLGLFTLAGDLRGSDIYLDVKERPDFVHRLMEIVTEKTIRRMAWINRTYGYPEDALFINDDSAAALSPRDYRRFVLPYNLRLKQHFGGKLTLHCCGPATHLVPIWANELGVDAMWNYSYETDRRTVAEHMGGRVVLMGNVNWKLMAHATAQGVYEDALDVLRTYAGFAGHILSTPNIPPGTPVENINAMHAAAAAFAAGEGR